VVCTVDELKEGETITCHKLVSPPETTTYIATAVGHDVLGGPAEDKTAIIVVVVGEVPDDEDEEQRDSDGDGASDAEEGLHDSDGDGIPDWLDPDPTPQEEPKQYKVYLPIIAAGS
jgi:hypothetical protein